MSGGRSNQTNINWRPDRPNAPTKQKELQRSETAYVPNFLQRESNDVGDDLLRKIRLVLNKIVPQNFEKCIEELEKLDFRSETGLQILLDTIFDKAVKEEVYSATFARMCKHFAQIKAGTLVFKSILLTKCQKMFTERLKSYLARVAEDWDKKVAEEENETKRKFLVEVKDEQVQKARDKYYGNIRFIGELFMAEIMTSRIIVFCLQQLTAAGEPEDLESLCKLLDTTGSKMEKMKKNKAEMDICFQKIDNFINSEEVANRLRYKLMEIKETRSRGWQKRKIQEEREIKPMTKEELERRKQIEKEKEMQVNVQDRKSQAAYGGDRRTSGAMGGGRENRPPPRDITPIGPWAVV